MPWNDDVFPDITDKGFQGVYSRTEEILREIMEKQMNICMMVHSLTGNTMKLAETLADALTKTGHKVTVIQLQTDVPLKYGSIRQKPRFEITNLPSVAEYDAVCAGGPVWGFGPSPVIFQAIRQLDKPEGKMFLPFTTMGFPFACLGGNNTLKIMGREAAARGAKVLPGIVIPRMFRNFLKKIDEEIQKSLSCFK